MGEAGSPSVEVVEFEGEVSEVYDVWLAAAARGPWEAHMGPGVFAERMFRDPVVDRTICIVARAGGRPVGAAHAACIRPRKAAMLDIWVRDESAEEVVRSKLLDEITARLGQEQGIERVFPQAVPFCAGQAAFYKARGFVPLPEAPGGFLMEMRVAEAPPPSAPDGVEILRIVDIESFDRVDQMAALSQEYSASAGHKFDLGKEIEGIKHTAKKLSEYCFSVADVEGRVAGYALHAPVRTVAGQRQLRNRGLVVSEKHRNRGIGRALLLDGLRWGAERGLEVAYISTHSANPAKALYERVGYRTVETLDLLVKDLPPHRS